MPEEAGVLAHLTKAIIYYFSFSETIGTKKRTNIYVQICLSESNHLRKRFGSSETEIQQIFLVLYNHSKNVRRMSQEIFTF
jgi:hypothetical protein